MTLSTIRLRSPADLLAVIPHVLGFHPARSVVLRRSTFCLMAA